MVAATPGRADTDQRFLLDGVSRAAYVALRDSLDQAGRRYTRLIYLDGQLELLTSGQPHAESKTIIGRLLETWADELDVDLRGFGGMTLRREIRRRGLVADAALTIHRLEAGAYIAHARSALLPTLDPDLLARFIRPGDSHTALAKAYRAALQSDG